MKIILWHGYLLSGTGSNVYTREIARAWSRGGHEVTVVCQEHEPERFDLGGAKVVTPALPGGLLPVFVLDAYEGLEARLLQELTAEERRRYVDANAACVAEQLPADLVFCNHVLLGGAVGAAAGAPFAVKAHGSELEYSIRGRVELADEARAALASASAVFVGSKHIAAVLAEVVGEVPNVLEVPPGVDVDEFMPEARRRGAPEAARGVPPRPATRATQRAATRRGQRRAAGALHARRQADRPLLREAPLQQGRPPVARSSARDRRARRDRRFSDYRRRLEELAPRNTLFTGPLEHRHLVHLIPLADAVVVPSIFPEAFGMVAGEAAAAGCPPLVFEAIVPKELPGKRELVYGTGVAEILGGAALLARPSRKLGWLLIALLLIVFPANLNQAFRGAHYEAMPEPPRWVLFARLPVQALMIWLVLAATRPSDG